MSDNITLYNTRTVPPTEESVDLKALLENLRYAIYRFWINERRMPVAAIIPLQLAQKLSNPIRPVVGSLYYAGMVDDVPLLARDSYIDPLFLLI